MKRLIIGVLAVLLTCGVVHSADEWRDASTTFFDGDTTLFNDIDTEVADHLVGPLSRLLAGYRKGCKIEYKTAATLTVETGEIVTSNAAGTLRKMRRNTSDTEVVWGNIDEGAEATSTTYYIYAVADADATTFTVNISASPTVPKDKTSYVRLGTFYNNASDNIEQITNDDTHLITSMGTTANAGTIALPSGYLESQCDWVIGGNTQVQTDGDAESSTGLTVSVTSRVVTCSVASSGATDTYGATCSTNYLMICYK